MSEVVNGLGIVCPFCPLHCDDVHSDDVSIESPPNCWIFNDALASLKADPSKARVGDLSVTIDQASQAARKRLDESDRVTILVRSATLGQAKAIVNSGFTIRTESSPTTNAVQKAITRCGVIAATLADVKQHADTLVVVGDVDRTVPRLMQKLGDSANVHAIPSPSVDSVAELAFKIRKKQQFASSAYVAFILDSHCFDKGSAGPAVELLIETIIWMNSSSREINQRAVLVTLDPLASLRCVAAWSSNQPLLSAVPVQSDFACIRLGEPAANLPPADIQIGGLDPGPKLATIYLPASTPGIHHIDAVIRGDSTVTLPLGQIQTSSMPSVPDWIFRLG